MSIQIHVLDNLFTSVYNVADACGKKDLCFHSSAYLALSNVHLLGVIYTVVSCDTCIVVL